MIFVAGMIGWDDQQQFPGADLVAQTEQALRNVVAVLDQAGAKPDHVTRMTWYLTSRDDYLNQAADIGAVYRDVMGKHYPVMTAVQVQALMEEQAVVEIEVTAVIPDESGGS
jgi:enamine deaminase RidA (YjgF/YER057c/UK114 family)